MNTCRFCKDYNNAAPLFKYGVRHYAHAACGVKKFGFIPFLDKLPVHQIKALPYRLCVDNGYEIDAMEAYAAKRERAAA